VSCVVRLPRLLKKSILTLLLLFKFTIIILPGKIPVGSKITKVNNKICLVVNPTLAGSHQ